LSTPALSGRVLALSGGVGGAKLVCGLARVLEPERLVVVCNTGDDFEHLGLAISPDLDSVTYALAGLNDDERGWGRADETWNCMGELERLGAESWFRLGDRDLAVHLERTRRLAAGESLSEVTRAITRALGIAVAVAPMSDEPVRTRVQTDQGELSFQHYFVRERCQPIVRGLRYHGAEHARPSAALRQALEAKDLAAIVICPSNPWLSIDPILALPGLVASLRAAGAPVIAVSPIVDGRALKGPTDKILRELGELPSALAIAEHYATRRLDGLLFDLTDAHEQDAIAALGIAVGTADTIMRTAQDRERLARDVLDLCARI
jgi:LPPG:FO 2-phospho-L-lactate transferase